MADIRIVDAPEIPTENITGEEKIPTGGSGNYSITLDSVADYTKTKKDLVDTTTVDSKVGGVRQELDVHIEDLLNPHQVTKGQIGLGNVDNTADADKPVSNSTQATIISAVSPKADKTYVDNQLTLKANKADVYTKSETYTKQESSDLVNNSISTALTPINTSLDLAKRGIENRYDPLLTYNSGERVVLTNGDIVKSTIDSNTNDPNVDMTGWVKDNSASQIFDESGSSQQEINNSKPEELATYSLLRSYSGSKINAVIGGRSNYFDGGFGRFAVKISDTTSTDNDGTIIVDALGRRWHRIIQTEYGNPEWFGMSESVADNAPLVEKCLNIVGSAFIRRGEFPILNTLRVLAGQMLIGQVDKSIFVINDSTKAGILTHDYSTNNGVAKTQQGISIKNIRVKGNAKFGFGFTHCTQGDFSGLSIDGLAATDGYIFEGLWNCHFNDFKSNGAILTGSAFKINKIVLNSEFRSFYSSNFCNFSLTVNSTIAEISVNTWAGFGELLFESFAAQGANKCGINIVQANNIIFNGMYTENCLAALHIGTAQTITFNTCSFVGVRSASSLYEMWLGYSSSNTMSGIVFNQCRHGENKYPIIMDYAGLGVTFNQPLVTFNTPLISKVQRTANTNGGMPFTIYRDAGGIGTTDVKKTNNYAWKFVVESVNDNNVVTRTVVIPPVTTVSIVS